MRNRTSGVLFSLVTAVALGAGAATSVLAAPPKAPATAPKAPTATTPPAKQAPASPSKAAMPAMTAPKIGAPAPVFLGVDIDGAKHSLADFKGKIVVLEWFNPECPFVKRSFDNKVAVNTYNQYKGKDVVWVLVNSGAPGQQGNGIEKNKQAKATWGFDFPIIADEAGVIGHMYGATNTPQMFIIGKDGTLMYAGAVDNDNAGDKFGKPGYVNYVDQALKQIIAGETVTQSQTKPYGCSVKYAS